MAPGIDQVSKATRGSTRGRARAPRRARRHGRLEGRAHRRRVGGRGRRDYSLEQAISAVRRVLGAAARDRVSVETVPRPGNRIVSPHRYRRIAERRAIGCRVGRPDRRAGIIIGRAVSESR